MPRHSLSAKDLTAREAVCSVCGPVALKPNGPAKWICANKKRESEDAYRLANPDKVRQARHKKSTHHLTEVDPVARSGVCPIDGEVFITAAGRGWMCGVRAAQMGRTVDLTAVPTARCAVCGHWGRRDNPVKGDRCLYHFVGWEYAAQPHTATGTTDADKQFLYAVGSDWKQTDDGGTGYEWVNLRSYEERAEKVRAKESAVPGWRMTGQNVPTDEWAKWNELLAREGLQ